jgi:hypothetical protein
VVNAPPGWDEEAINNFNRAQLAAEKARLLGEDPDEAFRQSLLQSWGKEGQDLDAPQLEPPVELPPQ